MSKYLEFKEIPFEGKAEKFEVISKNHRYVLGRISFYPQWLQYVFSPSSETIWNKDCLNDIQKFLDKLTKNWKEEVLLNSKKRKITDDFNLDDVVTYNE